jgi:hypothetical protein
VTINLLFSVAITTFMTAELEGSTLAMPKPAFGQFAELILSTSECHIDSLHHPSGCEVSS